MKALEMPVWKLWGWEVWAGISVSHRVLPICTLWLMRSHLIFFVYDFFPRFHFPRIKTRPPSKNSKAKGFYIFKDFDIYGILFSRTFLPIGKCVYISMTDCIGLHQYLALFNLEIVASRLGKKSLVPVLIRFAQMTSKVEQFFACLLKMKSLFVPNFLF